MQKLLIFFGKTISICVIFNDQNFNDTLTNDIVSVEQLSPEVFYLSHDRWINLIFTASTGVYVMLGMSFSSFWGHSIL